MLFNSYEFIFLFLPIVYFGFFRIARASHRLAALWLAVASLFFYGWWNPQFVPLLLASIGANYALGCAIGHARLADKSSKKATGILVVAIAGNLLLLGYFKYTNFLLSAVHEITGTQWGFADVVLPLGISIFTFTQIAFLVDVHRGIAHEYNFIHYLLFVSYFPHLIAGPILHHLQVMPQFGHASTYKLNVTNVNIGLTIFIIGLLKKVILADQFALFANPVFDAAAVGGEPKLIEAWAGALAYALQIYFDFSGYSDMAIGISRMFNVTLPLNFDSPYKAESIIEFWRRWHMTLSAFLRDYLYVSLGGNRRGSLRRYANLMTTMLLGGLWHGAGWNFILWGGMHGIYLVLNHGWRKLIPASDCGKGRLLPGLGILLTFSVVVVAWVPFRANDFESTVRILSGMVGVSGVSLPIALAPVIPSSLSNLVSLAGAVPLTGLPTKELVGWILGGLLIVWGLPNTQQWLANGLPAGDALAGNLRFGWRPTRLTAVVLGTGLAISILGLTRTSQFVYFRF